MDQTKSIWTRPKQIRLDKNDLDGPKSFWNHRRTRQKMLSGVGKTFCGTVVMK